LGGGHLKLALADDSPISFELEVLELINVERENRGLHPLCWNDQLFAAARGHSEDMAANGFFDHENPDGQDPTDRAVDAGYPGVAGENIGRGYTTPQRVVDVWMNSDEHRDNILNSTYCDAGVGYAKNEEDYYKHYWTLNPGRQTGVYEGQCSSCSEPEPEPKPEPEPEPDEPKPEPEPEPEPDCSCETFMSQNPALKTFCEDYPQWCPVICKWIERMCERKGKIGKQPFRCFR
jgi:hypothetical protein